MPSMKTSSKWIISSHGKELGIFFLSSEYSLVFHVTTAFSSFKTATSFHRIVSRKGEFLFSYSPYYKRGTDMVASILKGNWKEVFRRTHARSLA